MSDPASRLVAYCEDLAGRAKAAARTLALASTEQKNHWLTLAAESLKRREAELLGANKQDLTHAQETGLSPSQIDRLRLTPARLKSIVDGLETVRTLPDPVGRVLEQHVRPNGLEIRKVAVPLGVILFIYESRPNVTVDAAALAVKSGNAIILRGGKEALGSNQALHAVLGEALDSAGLPRDAVQFVSVPERGAVNHLLQLHQYIDLAIPRGGEGLIRIVAELATMPVLKHYQGNCHIYVDKSADLDMAERILLNAKCQRPGVCNAAESLLVHTDVASTFLPRAAAALGQAGVELRGCDRTRALASGVKPATEADYATEYLDLILSIKVVDNLDEAIDHINLYGSRHTDAIVTRDAEAAERFTARVDSAAVLVNASTRFHDGYEFGLGAEIGISTDKFHARGPCGLVELTTYKYVVLGNGQVRS
jgi:glutamate-5-semialdehyde dehydrogenase